MLHTVWLNGVALSVMDTVLELAASKYAIIGYLILLVAIIAVLIIFMLINSSKDTTAKAANVVIQNQVGGAPIPTTSVKPSKEKATVVSGGEDEELDENAPRFCMLSRIDEEKRVYDARKYEEETSLKRFCDNFRNYAAAELRLYYDIKDIRRFIAGMAVSPIIILQGMSGTGKTSLAHAMGSFVKNTSTVIPVQPMWKERTDLLGYYNEFTKRFNETLLLEKMYEANYCKDIYVTVLDEMNIARVEYYFA
jgi:hypothetical protein